jgi:aspartate 1-decarboxylase
MAGTPSVCTNSLTGGIAVHLTMLKSKLHRVRVTEANLNYVGSVTIDQDLLDAAGLLPGEQVAIVDIDTGARLETYVIAGRRESGVIGINGAAARLVHPGDLVIIIGYCLVDAAEARALEPKVVFVDNHNRIAGVSSNPGRTKSGDLSEAPSVSDDGSHVAR